jgi:peptidoglycan hydrolase-like protein with peptidoglycan-binding domain
VDKPASTKSVAAPPAYQNVEVVKIAASAQEKRSPIAAEYHAVTERKAVTPRRVEWRSILCKTNMTGDRVRDIQAALKERGFDPGPIDGMIGKGTIKAMNAFQAANNLPQEQVCQCNKP